MLSSSPFFGRGRVDHWGRTIAVLTLVVLTNSVEAGGRARQTLPPDGADGRIFVEPLFPTLKACEVAAENGEVAAMVEMAWRYERGRGARPNPQETVRWLQIASKAGSSEAQTALGWRFANGNSVEVDLPKAADLYRRAAEQGCVVGGYEVGMALSAGRGISTDEAAAHNWFLKAAEKAYAPAQYQVGVDLETGRGTSISSEEAVKWYRSAADQKHIKAQYALGQMYRAGRGVQREPRRGLQWILKAATQGHQQAQLEAARILRDGNGVRQDLDEAARWLEKLAKRGHRTGQIELSQLAPKKYKKATRSLSFKGTRVNSDPGSAVWTEGWIERLDENMWTLALDPQRKVVVDASRIDDRRLQRRHFVKVYGILDVEGTIEVLVVYVPPPTFKYQFAVQVPEGVAGGKVGRYLVVGSVRNTSKQPIKNLCLNVRMYQVQSPNDRTQTATIANLQPGETRTFSVTFRFYNFRHIGHSSVPRAEVSQRSIEW